MNTFPLILTLGVMLAGCASPPAAPQTAKADAQDCERSERVGSHIASKDCLPPMSDEERQRALDAMRAGMRLPGPGNGN